MKPVAVIARRIAAPVVRICPLGLLLAELQIHVEKEYRFHSVRRWRFDYAIPENMIAMEFEGAIWINGRHTRGGGFHSDCDKYNTATSLGWRVYRFTANHFTAQQYQKTKDFIELIYNE